MSDALHITAGEAAQFRDGRLPAEELLRIAHHVDRCAECRARLQRANSASAAAAALGGAIHAVTTSPPWHIARADVKQYVRGRLDAADTEVLESHFEDCPECSALVTARRSRDRAARSFFAAAAAVLALIAIATWWTLANHTRVPVAPTRPVARVVPPPAPPPAPNRHDYGRADWNTLVATALHAGIVSLPDLTDLQPPRDTLRGESTSRPVKLTPAGLVVESDRPRFSWPRVKGARHYSVLVYANDQEAAKGGPLTATTWQPARPLARGKTYEWQVICSMDDGSSTPMPAPPDPSPHFRVLSEKAAAELKEAETQHPDDHLLLGVLAAHHGLAGRAESELRTYSAAYPQEPLVRLNHQ